MRERPAKVLRRYELKKLLLLFAVALFVLSGCIWINLSRVVKSRPLPPSESHSLGSLQNNQVVYLKSGRYPGNILISANMVSLIGAGVGKTFIDGDIVIFGNSCSIRALTVSGDVALRGNNNNLKGASIRGNISSSGYNNLW
jgi:hypothetical protein